MSKESVEDHPRYKVGKVIKRRSLVGMGDELEAYWLGKDGEKKSLRELADYFNKAVLRSTFKDNERQYLTGDVENTYRLLTGDDVSSGERTQVRRSLEGDGVEVSALKSDFVTHQAIHTYLTEGRGVEKDHNSKNQVDSSRKTINRLKNRLVAVTETILNRLNEKNTLVLGDFDVLVDVTVHCSKCGSHAGVLTVLADGGCDCKGSENSD